MRPYTESWYDGAVPMIRKHRSLSERHPSKARGVLGVHKVPPRRHVSSQPEKVNVPHDDVFVSTGNPKQDLILAHAHVRRGAGEQPHGRLWIGIAIVGCVLAVFFGWWMTFGVSLRAGAGQGSGGLFQVIRQSTHQLKQNLRDPVQDARSELKTFAEEQAAKKEALKRMAEELRQAQVTSTK